MERIIDCPLCFDKDSCFEDIQEEFKSYMCFNCGFMSSTYYTEDNTDRIRGSAKVIKELEFYDEERKIYWYPSVVNMGELGIIYPFGDKNNWNWKFASIVKIDESEKEKYPILGKEGEYYTERLDVDHAMDFGQYEFLQACQAMGIVGNNLTANKN